MRSFYHDYHKKCIYHITLQKRKGVSDFSRLKVQWPDVSLQLYPSGRAIAHVLSNLSDINPILRCLQYVVMPDHVHFLLFVTQRAPFKLGAYIGMIKAAVLRQLRQIEPQAGSLFVENFHDRILQPDTSLNTIFQYIRDNPRRLAVRQIYPELFRRVNRFTFNNCEWQAYGNVMLLDNPFPRTSRSASRRYISATKG